MFFDEAAKALELFDTANVAVAYATATGALQLTDGKTESGGSLAGGARRGPVHRLVEHARTNIELEDQLTLCLARLLYSYKSHGAYIAHSSTRCDVVGFRRLIVHRSS